MTQFSNLFHNQEVKVYKMGWKDVDQTHCHHLDREEGMWLGVRLKVYLTVNAL